jgi:putative FmdB family regulatory protein
MPRYDYKCDDCSDVFETTHGVEDAVEECPRCGGKVRRLFHPVGIIFKGSGFYKTDYRSSSSSSGNGGEKQGSEKLEKELETVKEKGPEKKENAAKKSGGD